MNTNGSCASVTSYRQLDRLGEGTYGIVYKAAEINNPNNIVALKKIRIDKESEGLAISAQREISLLTRLNHKNVVKVVDIVVGRELKDIFLVMEYCQNDLGYIMDNVISKTKGYSTAQVKCLMIQLLEGVSYLHSKFIIHRDLKLSNLLLTKSGILKIGKNIGFIS